MTYYEFVRRPRTLRRRVLHKVEDVRLKEVACMSTTASFKERVQTSPVNSTELSYIRYIDAKNELDKLMEDLRVAQDEVREFFYDNLCQDYANLLEWKYIDDKRLQDIAVIEDIAYQTAKNKISKAEKKARMIWTKMHA